MDYEAFGKMVVRLIIAAFYLAMIGGGIWIANDLLRANEAGEITGFWLTIMVIGIGGLAVSMVIGGVIGIWRILTGRFDGLDTPRA